MPAPTPHHSDTSWLLWICLSRAAFALIFTAYSAAIPLLISDWGMSAGQTGLVQSAWHAGYLVSLFTVGFLADRYGAKRVFLFSSVGASVSALTFAAFADGFVSAALLYGLTGLLSGGSYTPGLTLISERFASAKRGHAMGSFLAAASLGYALALVVTWLAAPSLGWRGAFVINACGPMLGTLFAIYALRGTPNLLHARAPEQAAASPIAVVLKNKPAMLVTWGYAAHSWELMGLKAWMPAFLAAAAHAGGSSLLEAASLGAGLTALTYFTSMAGGYMGGWISDRRGRTWTMLAVALGSMSCSFALGWMVSLPLWLILMVACIYSFLAIADSSVYSTAVTELVPRSHIGAAYAVRSVIGFGAGALSPWVFGLVLDATGAAALSLTWSWGLAWCALGVGAMLGPVATLQLRRMPESARMAGGKR